MRILHLENNANDAELVRRALFLEWPGSEITLCADPAECRRLLRQERFDLVLSDFTMPSLEGLPALEIVRSLAPDTPFIILSRTIDEGGAVEAIRRGADDYVSKDRIRHLSVSIRRSLRERDLRRQRTEAERRVREQAEMLNQAHDAILITDLEGRLLYWNKGAESLLGWSVEDVLGRTAADLFDPAIAAGLQIAVAETLATGAWHGEMKLHDKNRRPLFVEMRRTLIRDDAGRPKAHLSISSDITGRKHVEEQLLRVQRLENIGLLAAGIAHDLNNMLAPILLIAPMLRNRATNQEDLAMLATLEKSAECGAGLVRQILSFANGAAGETSLLQVAPLIDDVSSLVRETFPKSVTLESCVQSDLWAIEANSTQIRQLLLNLCINARDAMPEGGVLRITAENRILDSATAEHGRSGNFILMQVEDTGTGIEPEILKNMWKPFFTTKTTDKGNGLGLSTARGILEKHRGFVSVLTRVGEGSCFQVFLPAVSKTAEETATSAKASDARNSGKLIMVVDDEVQVRDLTAAILRRAGYRVFAVGGGEDAVKLYADSGHHVSLVILDTHMADFDGPTVARALRKINSNVKILGMSGLSLGGTNVEEAKRNAHTIAFLQKPFKPETLLAAVRDVLHGQEETSATCGKSVCC